jgi:hypothetical protein
MGALRGGGEAGTAEAEERIAALVGALPAAIFSIGRILPEA